MARIAGVDIPREKRLEVSLTYIFGVGRSTAKKIVESVQVDGTTRVKDLTEAEVKGAPERTSDWHRDRAWEQRVHEHYGAPMYWI